MRQLFFRLLHGAVVFAICLMAALWSLWRLTGDTGLTEIGDDEVAVIYNQWSGSTREVDLPGNELFLPFVERVFLQKRSPQELVMRGDVRESSRRVPEVRLRTSDGSIVRFGTLAVRFSLKPDSARRALEDWGVDGDLGSALVEAHTRSIVSDEYGRFSTEDILLRKNQAIAHTATLDRLRQALAPHGMDVLDLSTPKLRFDSSYEKSVEDRKLTNQEVERLKAEYRQLDAERDQRMAALGKEKLIELNATRLQIQKYMATIEQDGRLRRAQALQYKQDRLAQAANRVYLLESQALAFIEQVNQRANVLREEVQQLATTGAGVVREAWIENLSQIPLRVQPFQGDARALAVKLITNTLPSN